MMKSTRRAVYLAHYRRPPEEFLKQHYYVVLLMEDDRAVVRRIPLVPTESDRILPMECDSSVVETAVYIASAQDISELNVVRGRFDPSQTVEQIVSLNR